MNNNNQNAFLLPRKQLKITQFDAKDESSSICSIEWLKYSKC